MFCACVYISAEDVEEGYFDDHALRNSVFNVHVQPRSLRVKHFINSVKYSMRGPERKIDLKIRFQSKSRRVSPSLEAKNAD